MTIEHIMTIEQVIQTLNKFDYQTSKPRARTKEKYDFANSLKDPVLKEFAISWIINQ